LTALSHTPSYHDLYITTAGIARTSIFNLGYSLEVTCTHIAGWQLWYRPDSGYTGAMEPAPQLLAGEYASPEQWLGARRERHRDRRQPPHGEGGPVVKQPKQERLPHPVKVYCLFCAAETYNETMMCGRCTKDGHTNVEWFYP